MPFVVQRKFNLKCIIILQGNNLLLLIYKKNPPAPPPPPPPKNIQHLGLVYLFSCNLMSEFFRWLSFSQRPGRREATTDRVPWSTISLQRLNHCCFHISSSILKLISAQNQERFLIYYFTRLILLLNIVVGLGILTASSPPVSAFQQKIQLPQI